MKAHAANLGVTHYTALTPPATSKDSTATAWRETNLPGPNPTSDTPEFARQIGKRTSPSAFRTVTLLAFGQSLLFLVFWLWFCMSAGAQTAAPQQTDFSLEKSSYKPTKARDPFQKVGAGRVEVTGVAANPVEFHLQGILYEANNPSAIVNDELVTINKIVTLKTLSGEIQVKAVEITREKVVLNVGGQRIELRMDQLDARGGR